MTFDWRGSLTRCAAMTAPMTERGRAWVITALVLTVLTVAAAEARHHISWPQPGMKQGPNSAQHFITDQVRPAVVDSLEVVKVGNGAGKVS